MNTNFYTTSNMKNLINIIKDYMSDKFNIDLSLSDTEENTRKIFLTVMTDVNNMNQNQDKNLSLQDTNIQVLAKVKDYYCSKLNLTNASANLKKPNIQNLTREQTIYGDRPLKQNIIIPEQNPYFKRDDAQNTNDRISIDKLLALAQSKGFTIEQKGGLFSYNINQQTLNDKNELDIVSTLYEIVKYFYKSSFKYKLGITNPKVNSDYKNLWDIGLTIKLIPQKDVVDLANFIHSSLSDIALPMSELENYSSIGKNVYPVSISLNKDHFNYFLLRNNETRVKIDEIITFLITSATDFNVNLGIDEIKITYFLGVNR